MGNRQIGKADDLASIEYDVYIERPRTFTNIAYALILSLDIEADAK